MVRQLSNRLAVFLCHCIADYMLFYIIIEREIVSGFWIKTCSVCYTIYYRLIHIIIMYHTKRYASSFCSNNRIDKTEEDC